VRPKAIHWLILSLQERLRPDRGPAWETGAAEDTCTSQCQMTCQMTWQVQCQCCVRVSEPLGASFTPCEGGGRGGGDEKEGGWYRGGGENRPVITI